MVTTLNITLDDDVAERARQVKEDRGLTWAEYIEVAADALAEGSGDD
jgi:antitoxin component of RelBE/YafQ-DinJ toxin-antitoxin module